MAPNALAQPGEVEKGEENGKKEETVQVHGARTGGLKARKDEAEKKEIDPKRGLSDDFNERCHSSSPAKVLGDMFFASSPNECDRREALRVLPNGDRHRF